MWTLWGSSKLHGRLFDQVDDQQIPSKFEIVLSEMNLVMISWDVSMNSPKQSLSPFFFKRKTENYGEFWKTMIFQAFKNTGWEGCLLSLFLVRFVLRWHRNWSNWSLQRAAPGSENRIRMGFKRFRFNDRETHKYVTCPTLCCLYLKLETQSPRRRGFFRQIWKAVESCNAFRTLDFRVLWFFLLGFAKKTGWRAVFLPLFQVDRSADGGNFSIQVDCPPGRYLGTSQWFLLKTSRELSQLPLFK